MGIAFWLPWIVFLALFMYFFWRRAERNGDNELARRLARSRVEVKWIPLWMRLGVLGYLVAYSLSKYFERKEILNFVMPVVMSCACLHYFVLGPRRKREFREKLRACNDRICPQCMYSLEDGRPDGTCPECGTAYTDEGLHAAWAFLHRAETKNQTPPA